MTISLLIDPFQYLIYFSVWRKNMFQLLLFCSDETRAQFWFFVFFFPHVIKLISITYGVETIGFTYADV